MLVGVNDRMCVVVILDMQENKHTLGDASISDECFLGLGVA